jgi:Cu/Zn superoxide dismutase
MKTALKALLVVALVQFALAAANETVEAITKDPSKFDKKEVKVVGKVEDFKQKTSRKGNHYFTFKVVSVEKKDEALNVYSQGKMEPELKDGDKVEVWGVFRQEKKVQDFTVKNEIDATTLEEKGKKKFGVKLIRG